MKYLIMELTLLISDKNTTNWYKIEMLEITKGTMNAFVSELFPCGTNYFCKCSVLFLILMSLGNCFVFGIKHDICLNVSLSMPLPYTTWSFARFLTFLFSICPFIVRCCVIIWILHIWWFLERFLLWIKNGSLFTIQVLRAVSILVLANSCLLYDWDSCYCCIAFWSHNSKIFYMSFLL